MANANRQSAMAIGNGQSAFANRQYVNRQPAVCNLQSALLTAPRYFVKASAGDERVSPEVFTAATVST